MLNTVILQGRMTRDVELRYTQSEKAVASFTVACDRGGRDGGTDFIPVVAWEKTAQFVNKYFKKGDLILVQGRLQQRNYEDKNGNKRTAYEVIVGNVNFCGSKGESKPANVSANVSAQDFVELDDSDGELPF